MFFPKRVKYLKKFKGRIKGWDNNKCAVILQYGVCGLQALENGRITPKQMESARQIITRKLNKMGCLWIGIFADTPISAKPLESRMGKGKGSFNYWAAKVKKGRILFEVIGVKKQIGIYALKLALKKLPIKTQIIIKN